MAERSYNGRNIYTSLIEGATGGVAVTANNWIEAEALGWYCGVVANAVSAQYDTSVLRTGSKTLKLSTTGATGRVRGSTSNNFSASGSGATISTYGIPVKPLSTYTLSCYVKTNNAATNAVDIAVYSETSAGVFVNAESSNRVSGTQDWTLLTKTFTTQANVSFIRLSCRNEVAGNISDAWFDINSLQLTEVLPARTTATSRTTATNRVTVRDMGTALSFDGVDDHVAIYNNVAGNFLTTNVTDAFSFASWFKFKPGNPLMLIRNNDNSLNGVYLTAGKYKFSGRVFVGGSLQPRFDSLREIQPNIAYFGVYTVSNGLQSLYINGALDRSGVVPTGNFTLGNSWHIGRRPGGAEYFSGIIDDPRIWNRALTATEIQNLYLYNIVPQDGLVAEYLFNEGSGSTALDTSGNNNHGTITSATYTTDTPLKLRSNI